MLICQFDAIRHSAGAKAGFPHIRNLVRRSATHVGSCGRSIGGLRPLWAKRPVTCSTYRYCCWDTSDCIPPYQFLALLDQLPQAQEPDGAHGFSAAERRRIGLSVLAIHSALSRKGLEDWHETIRVRRCCGRLCCNYARLLLITLH